MRENGGSGRRRPAAVRIPSTLQENDMKISGQAAIVTGGASGLGAAAATALCAAGAKVTLFDLGEEAVKRKAAELGCHFEICNVADDAGTEAAIDRAQTVNGVARIVINCAGIAPGAKAVGRDGAQPLAAFSKVITVNLIGTFNVIRLAAARLQAAEPLEEAERGVIINTASIAAFEGQIGQSAYAASKAGVVGMTLPLAREFARVGIRVVTIAPGVFETPMVGGMPVEVQASLAAAIPFPSRLGRPAEYAKLALAIIDNPFINGETIRLDGAQRMTPK
jgi:NAD(P)-dependent dehydrogenase (short-subunit alcohol dehydrogenase family)